MAETWNIYRTKNGEYYYHTSKQNKSDKIHSENVDAVSAFSTVQKLNQGRAGVAQKYKYRNYHPPVRSMQPNIRKMKVNVEYNKNN